MRRILKIFVFSIVLLVLIYIGLVIGTLTAQPEIETISSDYARRGGTAVVITGAAARIAQEVALLEKLQQSGWLSDVCFISGTSSGALNTVMLNSILENKFSWQRYHAILFNLRNENIFLKYDRTLPVDIAPLQGLLKKVINDSLGYHNLGDLPYHSSISISDFDLVPPFSKTYQLSNIKINDESNPDFNLVEVLLASSAIPILFPAVRFREPFGLPNSTFVDGGVSDDHIPYEAVLQLEKYRGFGVDTLIIVSRKSDTGTGVSNEVQDFGTIDSRIFYKLNHWIDNAAQKGFIKSMKRLQQNYPELAACTFVYIPDFEENFALLDFSDLKKQYEVTYKWAASHPPVPLNVYLSENDEGKEP